MNRLSAILSVMGCLLLASALLLVSAASAAEEQVISEDRGEAVLVDPDALEEETEIKLIQVINIRGNNPFDPKDPLGDGTEPGPEEQGCRCSPSSTALDDFMARILISLNPCRCRLEPSGGVDPDQAVEVVVDPFADMVQITVDADWRAVPARPNPFRVATGAVVDLTIEEIASGGRVRIVFVTTEDRLTVRSIELVP